LNVESKILGLLTKPFFHITTFTMQTLLAPAKHIKRQDFSFKKRDIRFAETSPRGHHYLPIKFQTSLFYARHD